MPKDDHNIVLIQDLEHGQRHKLLSVRAGRDYTTAKAVTARFEKRKSETVFVVEK